MIQEEKITQKIYFIRGEKIMIDRDLAELYGVETRVLNQAVRRHLDRFPEDFMFQLTKIEIEDWKSQFVISKSEIMGLRKQPLAFTEHGILMLSSVLNSKIAIEVNIQLVRIFSKMRKLINSHTEILNKLEQLGQKNMEHEEKINLIFSFLQQLEQKDITENKTKIGYKNN